LDNYYIAAEASLQGHVITTSAFVNDFGEKAWLQTWGRAWRSELNFGGTLNVPSGFIWDRLSEGHIPYVDLGESVGIVNSAHDVNWDSSYPGVFFTLDVADADRATYFEKSLQRAATPLNKFTYMILPRNHTYGMAPGMEAPESMIADNDEATGRVVDTL